MFDIPSSLVWALGSTLMMGACATTQQACIDPKPPVTADIDELAAYLAQDPPKPCYDMPIRGSVAHTNFPSF